MSSLRRVATAALIASTFLSSAAFAAEEEKEKPAGDAIIVTGTRAVGQQAAQSATPIQVLSQEALTHVAQPNLNQPLTQIVPSF